MKGFVLVIMVLVVFLSFFSSYLKEADLESNIYVSSDLAKTFEKLIIKTKELPWPAFNTLSLKIDPDNGQTLYIGTKERGLLKSVFGQEQKFEEGLLKGASVYDIAIDSNHLYLAVFQEEKGRILKSDDKGMSWQETYVVANPDYAVFSLEVDKSNIVYAGTAEGGFLKSVDYGQSWQLVKWFDDVISDIGINPKDSREIYVSCLTKGIFKTTDEGITWQSLKPQLEKFRNGQKVKKILIDPKRPYLIYAASDHGILSSEDSGQSWQEMKLIMLPKPASSLCLDPNNPDILYYGADNLLYQSLDRGQTWKATEIGPGIIKAIAVGLDTIYVGLGK